MKGNRMWCVCQTAPLSSGQHTIQQLQHKNRPTETDHLESERITHCTPRRH